MAKTTINIPKMDAAIICRNKRELFAARVFVDKMESIAEDAVEGYGYALAAVEEFSGSTHWLIQDLYGMVGVFFHMDMLQPDMPISSVEIAEAVRAMYLEATGAAGNDPAAAEDAAADMYMDAVKADAAYCLGIDEGSDEWYALMEV